MMLKISFFLSLIVAVHCRTMMEIENPVGNMDNEQYRQMNGNEKSDYLNDDGKVSNDERRMAYDGKKYNKGERDDTVESVKSEKSDVSAKKESGQTHVKKERASRSHSTSSRRRRRRRRRHSSSSSAHTVSTKSRSRSRSRSRTKSHSRSRSPRRASSRSRSRSRRKSSKKKARRTSRSYSRSHSPTHRRKASRSHSPRRRPTRSSSSSSRDTYGSFKAMSPARPVYEYPCRKCDRDFETIRELCEHEIRAHGACFPCPHCEKQASSVQKLCEHMKRRHSDYRLLCDFCKDDFGGKISGAKDSNWEEFRDHIYKECLKEKIYLADRQRGRSAGVAQRGRGRCPHGPPVKCKNFPNCPGEKCYYFHGYCRYDKLCVKKECPFDHTDRPRICLSCLRDYKRRF
ncbi:Zinc finger, C2H2 type family protein [Brugia malayi]|uniref:Bm6331 n=3 Tax=Brugia malayi TaxID=6279 RepID=A0A4E9F2S4_BRUMA|nr:Zinc finger, C2H2 type family protein [Brugia malayi]VIO90052.1 Zinc finger, C2H2 type family protein [Brugia malayi]